MHFSNELVSYRKLIDFSALGALECVNLGCRAKNGYGTSVAETGVTETGSTEICD